MPPSRMSATEVRRGTFRSSQAAAMNAIHAPISSGSGRIRAGSMLGPHEQQHQAGQHRQGQADRGHP